MPVTAATEGCRSEARLSERGSTLTRGTSHRFLVSGDSNLPARSSNTSGEYPSSPRNVFHPLDTSVGSSQCVTQYLVLAPLAMQ